MAGAHRGWLRPSPRRTRMSKVWELPDTPDPLPFLPPPHHDQPTDVTPSSPHQQGSHLTPAQQRSNYGLFGRLPYELRRQILTEAFSGRTLHVSLKFGHPLVPRQPARATGRHGRRTPVKGHCGLDSLTVTDRTQRPAWQWFSCVCHRSPHWTPRMIKKNPYLRPLQTIELWEDDCLNGHLCTCADDQSPLTDDDCYVGVMGWLLTCREAYVC
jgi:hypothetical protein